MGSRFNQPSLKMAKLESGMDNSPMYDEAEFDNVSTNLMQMYDVGMSSLVVSELRHLAHLANATAFRGQRRAQSRTMSARAQLLGGLVRRHLWNEELGIFTNRHVDGWLSTHPSPSPNPNPGPNPNPSPGPGPNPGPNPDPSPGPSRTGMSMAG